MNRGTVVAMGLCIAFVANFAQAENVPIRGPIPFATYDKGKSGGINDRQLSKAELAQAQQVQIQPRSDTGAGPGAGPGMGQMQGQGQERRAGTGPLRASFADYDLNSDGQITQQEFNEARAKRIEERAEAGGQLRNLPNAPTFGDLDANHDGIITAEEFVAHQVQRRSQRP